MTWDPSADSGSVALRSLVPQSEVDHAPDVGGAQRPRSSTLKKKILAQKLDHNGDFLLALPAFAKLRARYPDAQLDVLVGSWNRDAAEASGLFDTIYTLDYFKSKSSMRASVTAD